VFVALVTGACHIALIASVRRAAQPHVAALEVAAPLAAAGVDDVRLELRPTCATRR